MSAIARWVLASGIFSVFLLSADSANALTYYVDQRHLSASDSNPGTEAQPFLTLTRATQVLQAGDTVIVKAGTYSAPATNDRFVPAFHPANSGTAGAPITLMANPGDRVTLAHSGPAGPVIGSSGRNYIIWDGFYIDEANAAPHPDTGPIAIFSATGCIVRNCEVRGITATYVDNHNAIRLERAVNTMIINNKLYGVRRFDGTSHNAAAIMMYYCDATVIEGNTIYSSNCGIFPKGGDNTRTTIRYNQIFDCVKGIRVSFSITQSRIYQNIIRGCNIGINLAGGVRDFIIANNTIYNVSSGLYFSNDAATNSSGNFFFNNIIANTVEAIGAGDVTAPMSFVSIQHNTYSSFTNFAYAGQVLSFNTWKANTGMDQQTPASLSANPQFIDPANNNFRLAPSSPSANSGVDVADLNNNGSTTDQIVSGAYITGSEVIGTGGAYLRPSAPSQLMIASYGILSLPVN